MPPKGTVSTLSRIPEKSVALAGTVQKGKLTA